MPGLLLALLLLGLPAAAGAAEWGGIAPGTTTMEAVRAHYGGPTRSDTQKVDGYDTARWIYEGKQAPSGLRRMEVAFGLVVDGRFRPEVVRALVIEPKPGGFTHQSVLLGWGKPDLTGPGKPPPFFYWEGLLVEFESDGKYVRSMTFTPPQQPPPPAGRRP